MIKCFNMADTSSYSTVPPAIDATIDVQVSSDLSNGAVSSGMSLTHPSSTTTVMLVGVNSTDFPPVAGHIAAIKLTGTGSTFAASKYWASGDFAFPGNVEYAVTQFPLVTNSSGKLTIATPSNTKRVYYLSF